MMNRSILITGGAGFIGANAAVRFARSGWRVLVFDNLSRRGAQDNLAWVTRDSAVEVEVGDIRDASSIGKVVSTWRPEAILHLAGQVAVTTSVAAPRDDFEANALGTLNVLEAVRNGQRSAVVIYASTNKVYGAMDWAQVVERDGRYEYKDLPEGVDEGAPLSFHSPYGCSKGAGDQYVLDYGRIFGMRTVSFRQSCIYGPRQFGMEDQGWVAWFTIAAVGGLPITICGDGKQVRDVLHVDDLLDAYESALSQPEAVRSEALNIGGGPTNTLSLLELLRILEKETGVVPRVQFEAWRPGDQRVFVSDPRKAQRLLGWIPKIGATDGVRSLVAWVKQNRATVLGLAGATRVS
jgi:CDP-paratose 2-epimerase